MTRTKRKEEQGDAKEFDRLMDGLRECSICGGPFHADQEGVSEGHIGSISVAMCSDCTTGIAEIVKGTEDDDNNTDDLRGIPRSDQASDTD